MQSKAGSVPPRLPFKISLAEWSLHRALFNGSLKHLDFPIVTKKEYGLDAIELVNQFFMDKAKDQKHLSEFKRRADDHGVKILLIMCDKEGAIGDADAPERKQAVENHFKWVEAAKTLGCHSIRVNAHATGTYSEQLEQAADGLWQLSEFAAQRELNVLVENHGGLSSNGEWLAAVVKKVDLPNCGILPDFGNFTLEDGTEYDRYKGVSEMMPFAKAVSAKTLDFDSRGDETRIDYRKMLRIVLGARYRGYIGIEYCGDRLGEPEGICATKALLERVGRDFSEIPGRRRVLDR